MCTRACADIVQLALVCNSQGCTYDACRMALHRILPLSSSIHGGLGTWILSPMHQAVSMQVCVLNVLSRLFLPACLHGSAHLVNLHTCTCMSEGSHTQLFLCLYGHAGSVLDRLFMSGTPLSPSGPFESRQAWVKDPPEADAEQQYNMTK